MRRLSFALLVAPLAGACGSTVDSSSMDASHTTTTAMLDAALVPADVSVPEPFVVRVESRSVSDVRAPVAAVEVRVERSDGTEGQEATTDATGTARFMVDLHHGAVSVTAYNEGYQAVSVVGVDAPLAAPIALTANPDVNHGAMHTISGTIAGRTTPGTRVIVDAASFQTVTTTSPTWSTHFFSFGGGAADEVPIHTAAIELDAMGHILNGVLGPVLTRGADDITDVALVLPAPARTPIRRDATIVFPATGLTAGTMLTAGRNPVTVGQAGNYASTYVGVGTVGAVTGNTAALHVEMFDGDLRPDSIEVDYTYGGMDSGGAVTISRATVADGERITLPTVRNMDISGDRFDNSQAVFDGDAPQGLRLIIAGDRGTAWTVRALHPDRTADLHMPHLPGGRTINDLTIATQLVGVVVAAYAPMPFDGYTQPAIHDSITVVSPYIVLPDEGR